MKPHYPATIARLFAVFAMTFAAALQAAVPPSAFGIYVDPACPSPEDSLEVFIVPTGGYGLLGRTPMALRVEGNTIAVVGEAVGTYFPEDQGFVVAKLPALPVGRYRVDFFTRVRDLANVLGPEQFATAAEFDVVARPVACEASRIEATSPFLTTTVGTPYPAPMQFRVTDAHGFPVAGETVNIARFAAPDETPSAPPPDVVSTVRSAVSDADGLVTVPVAANGVTGAFTYRAHFIFAKVLGRAAFVTFYNAPVESLRPTYPLVEYRRDIIGKGPHFFMTGYHDEMVKLDRAHDWQRTGAVLMTFPPGFVLAGPEPPCLACTANTTRPQPACRFYGLPEAGIDSHFFSNQIGECGTVATWSNQWVLETSDAFRAFAPDILGACPAKTRPAYRAFNNQVDANHRWALTPLIAADNGGRPWLNEGFGHATGPMLCLPQ